MNAPRVVRGRWILPACVVVGLAACGGDGPAEPEIPTVTGSWTIEFQGVDPGPDGPSGTLVLKEGPTGQLTGSGSLKFPHEPTRAFTVERGTHTYPDVYLLLWTSDQHSVEFLGEMSPDGKEVTGGLGVTRAVLVRQ